METAKTRIPDRRGRLRRLIMALAIAAAASSVTALPARADNDDWHRGHDARHEHMRREHEWRDHEGREHRAYAVPAYPGYGYAPPPVIYAPPPVVYAPPPSVNFVFP